MNTSASEDAERPENDHPQALPQVWNWRGTIAVEGKDSIDGRHVAPGALTWNPKHEIALTNGDGQKVGAVTRILRHVDTGLIRAEGTIEAAFLPAEGGLAVRVSGVLFNHEKGEHGEEVKVIVKHGQIRVVALDAKPIWDECRIDEADVPL